MVQWIAPMVAILDWRSRGWSPYRSSRSSRVTIVFAELRSILLNFFGGRTLAWSFNPRDILVIAYCEETSRRVKVEAMGSESNSEKDEGQAARSADARVLVEEHDAEEEGDEGREGSDTQVKLLHKSKGSEGLDHEIGKGEGRRRTGTGINFKLTLLARISAENKKDAAYMKYPRSFKSRAGRYTCTCVWIFSGGFAGARWTMVTLAANRVPNDEQAIWTAVKSHGQGKKPRRRALL